MSADGSLPDDRLTGDFDSLLAAVRAMSPEERERIAADAIGLTGGQIWVPNPGPQTLAYYCEADETLYGGTAGCGKTGLICGLSLTAHRRTLFLRRTNKEAAKIRYAYEEILGHTEGWNGQDDVWRMPDGRVIQVGGCQQEDDKQKYKGTPYDLHCVGRGTRVLMEDGSYRAIETLRVGERVQTLEGPRRIQRVYPIQRKEAVEVTARREDGAVIGRQVQSCSHALFCETGWFSADDLVGACASTESRSDGSIELSLRRQCSSLLTCLGRRTRGFLHTAESALRSAGHHAGLAMLAFGEQSILETCSAAFGDGRQGLLRLPLWSDQSRIGGPDAELFSLGSQPRSQACASSGARFGSLPAGSTDRYSSCSGRYGEHTPRSSGPSIVARGGQRCFLRRDGVARPIPIRSPDDASARTQTRTDRQDTYAHPYTKEIRRVDESCSLHVAAWETRPVGVVELFDLQVEEVNHFITESGFINKNCFDELCDFTETQYTFIIGWNRSADPSQRCRVVAATNPPTKPEGMWIVKYWGPWLDKKHPRPAKPGELRWFLGGEEVDGPGPHMFEGKMTRATSRTFIPGKLSDNPDLAQTNYDARLASQPEELRRAYRDGIFDTTVKTDAFQVIPTEWVVAAFERWSPAIPYGVPMSALAADIAQGGEDDTVLAYRYGGWYAPLVTKPGVETKDGASVAGLITAHRRNQCDVILDMTGGYGGGAYEVLKSNGIEVRCFRGYDTSSLRSREGQYKFFNARAAAYWKFREALDPNQDGGSQIALPESHDLLIDLVTLKWELTPQGIKVTPKEKVIELLRRSTDRGDAVVSCWTAGPKLYRAMLDANLREQGIVGQPSKIVDLGTRRQVSIVGSRHRG